MAKLGILLLILLLPLILFIAAAPVGATICGAVAIGRIRRSGGAMIGLGLAHFAALLYPLLALNGLTLYVMVSLASLIHFSGDESHNRAIGVLAAVVISVVTDVLIIGWAWRERWRKIIIYLAGLTVAIAILYALALGGLFGVGEGVFGKRVEPPKPAPVQPPQPAAAWETLAETEGISVSLCGDDNTPITFGAFHETDNGVAITVAHPVVGKELRIVAVDQDGTEHESTHSKESRKGNGRQLTATFTNVWPSDIRVFRFQVRPLTTSSER